MLFRSVRVLKNYKDKVCCYNDDIQGTSAVVLAGMMGALKIKQAELKDQKIFIFGAGSAGQGIAEMLSSAMQTDGLSKEDAESRIFMFDVNGLLVSSRTDLSDDQKMFAHDLADTKSLPDALTEIKPNILIGVSTVGGAFTQEVVEIMSQNNERPIIFALSNPTEHAECNAEQAYTWSKGKVDRKSVV